MGNGPSGLHGQIVRQTANRFVNDTAQSQGVKGLEKIVLVRGSRLEVALAVNASLVSLVRFQ